MLIIFEKKTLARSIASIIIIIIIIIIYFYLYIFHSVHYDIIITIITNSFFDVFFKASHPRCVLSTSKRNDTLNTTVSSLHKNSCMFPL